MGLEAATVVILGCNSGHSHKLAKVGECYGVLQRRGTSSRQRRGSVIVLASQGQNCVSTIS
jgi:hypothetical protein